MQSANVQQLIAALHQEWARTPQYLCNGEVPLGIILLLWLPVEVATHEIQDLKHNATIKSCPINHQFSKIIEFVMGIVFFLNFGSQIKYYIRSLNEAFLFLVSLNPVGLVKIR